ncbi:MAG: GNAT family N-acetyltransferase [Gammaproteobacteria bacterium]|jgi:RimJ/RimL family protein N-acetyltransferase
MVVLETERLRLRLPRESDLDPLAAMHADEDTMRYMGGTKDREQTWRSIAMVLGHWQMRGYGMFAVESRADGTFLGRVGFLYPEGWPGFEIGWLIGSEYRGRGYATEAATTALDWCFDALEENHVISLIHRDNAPSARVAEKLGEHPEGETRVHDVDVIIYGMDRSAWLARRAGA